MEYRPFGQTGLQVSAIGFGCWEIGGNYGKVDESEYAPAVQRAIDLGINVPTEKFVETVRQEQPDVVAMSALLTITAQEQKNVIEALTAAGLRDGVKVIVGGGAISQRFAESIGADGYAPTAPGGVSLTRELLQA